MNLLELAQKRCSVRKYASFPVEDEKLAYILEAGSDGLIGSHLQLPVFHHNPTRSRKDKNRGMLCTRMVPVRTALYSYLRRPQPVMETFFGSERLIWMSMWQSPRNMSAFEPLDKVWAAAGFVSLTRIYAGSISIYQKQ